MAQVTGQKNRRPVRIGNSMGAVTDLTENMAILAKRTDIDFIVGDWMSEYNMASKGWLRGSNLLAGDTVEEAAYESGFLDSFLSCFQDVATKGIKLVVNAGCSDTKRLYDDVSRFITEQGVDLKVAWIEGDEVHDALVSLRGKGHEFVNITTGKYISIARY